MQKYLDMLRKDHLYAPIHYIETNALTPSVYDPYSKEPSFKTVAVNIKILNKINDGGLSYEKNKNR